MNNKLLVIAIAILGCLVFLFGFKVIKKLVKIILIIFVLLIIGAIVYFRLM